MAMTLDEAMTALRAALRACDSAGVSEQQWMQRSLDMAEAARAALAAYTAPQQRLLQGPRPCRCGKMSRQRCHAHANTQCPYYGTPWPVRP